MKKIMAILVFGLLLNACTSMQIGPKEPTIPPTAEGTLPATEAPPMATEATVQDVDFSAYLESKDAAVSYLKSRLEETSNAVYVYKDFTDSVNHYTQKAKIDDGNSSFVFDMNENWQDDPYSGSSAIECHVKTEQDSWGGWLFLNGYLLKGETVPRLSFGEVEGVGMDLTGAESLSFMAKGAKGGEIVEFFTAGLGYDGETNRQIADHPDSSKKITRGFITLTDEWEEYSIDLKGFDISYISSGFGYVLSGTKSGDAESTFYLDDIRFNGPIISQQNAPRLIQSYETNVKENENHLYIQNAAFSYDNALAAMAFLSEGMQSEAQTIVDAFVYAVDHDRYQPDRVRNAYAYGDISAFPGWQSGARLPGWYDVKDNAYYEDQYQVGTNVGNSSFVSMALLQYYRLQGGEEYLATAKTIMNWVLDNCADSTPGFMAGYDGWPEGDGTAVYNYTYKSIEHNIDAYAVLKQLYEVTGNERYRLGYESALAFITTMYDQEKGCFYTGTDDDGVTPNKGNIVLDAQVWSLLSLGKDYFAPYDAALICAQNMRTEEDGFPFHAANTNGGWWPEGTAFTSLALREYNLDNEASNSLDSMMRIQQANGGFPAATVAELTTGFDLFTGDPWTYGNILHIAPAAWYVMAVNGFNPFSFE